MNNADFLALVAQGVFWLKVAGLGLAVAGAATALEKLYSALKLKEAGRHYEAGSYAAGFILKNVGELVDKWSAPGEKQKAEAERVKKLEDWIKARVEADKIAAAKKKASIEKGKASRAEKVRRIKAYWEEQGKLDAERSAQLEAARGRAHAISSDMADNLILKGGEA